MSVQIYSEGDTADLRANIGAQCRARRDALGITQSQAARKIGISAQFYARVECGHALPSVSTLTKIADALEVSVDTLLGVDALHPPMQPASYNDPRIIAFILSRARQNLALTRTIIAILKLFGGPARPTTPPRAHHPGTPPAAPDRPRT